MFCNRCGNPVDATARFCPKCGASVAGATPNANANQPQPNEYRDPNLIYPSPGMLTPGIAALLSVLVEGLGQILLGQVAKGLVVLGSVIVVCFFGSLITCGYGAIILVPLCVVLAAVDAYKIAKKLQEGRPVGKWEFF